MLLASFQTDFQTTWARLEQSFTMKPDSRSRPAIKQSQHSPPTAPWLRDQRSAVLLPRQREVKVKVKAKGRGRRLP